MRHSLVISIVALLLVATMATGAFFAIQEAENKESEKPVEIKNTTPVSSNASEIAEDLFKYIHISADNTEDVSSLVYSMSYLSFKIKSIDIVSGFLTVNYEVDSRTKYRFMNDYHKNFTQTCASLFVLVDGLKNVRLTISDNYGEFYSFSRDKNSFIYTEEMNNFNDDDFEKASKNLTNFKAFTEKLLSLQNTQSSSHLRKIYDLLDPNLQVMENSKELFTIALNDKNLAILSTLDINLSKYKNSSAELYFCNVEDYTISELKYYIFVFIDNEIIAFDIISSPMLYDDTIKLFR